MLKITCTYKLNTFTDVMNILKVLTPAEFTAELYIPDHGIRGTKKMYASNKKYNYKRVQSGLKADSFSFSLIEV